MLILHNGEINRSFPNPRVFKAIAIQDNKIIAIGTDEDVLSLADRNTEIINLRGKTVLPGLTDSHIHLLHLGKSLSMVNCETNSVEECFERLQSKLNIAKPGEWILGHGWNQNSWRAGFSALKIFTKLSTTNPIYLTAKSLHAGWANPTALEITGLNNDSVDPKDNLFGRDENGNLNGLVFESAMERVSKAIPPLSHQNIIDLLDRTQQELWKVGITGVHDFDSEDCFRALQEMDFQNNLRIRTVKSIPLENLDAVIQSGLRTNFGSNLLRIGSVKLFADGALGPRTAAMISPYENEDENSGLLLLSKEQIVEYGIKAAQNGISLAIHAIGDRANKEVIDAFLEIRDYEKFHFISGLNHRIEHVQLLDPNDIRRLSQQQIIASMQPIHLVGDMDTANRYWGTRSRYAYAFKSLIVAKTQIIFGSDAPVESFNPFIGIYAAATRKKYTNNQNPWYPEEKLQLHDIFAAYTLNSAKAVHLENHLGSLDQGKYADLIVLQNSPFKHNLEEIKNILPLATMVDGHWVWKKEEL